MLATKKGDNILIKVDFDQRDHFRRTVLGCEWDGAQRCWVAPATIATFRSMRKFDPSYMDPLKLTPALRNWYNELLPLAKRLDELQRGAASVTFPEDFKFAVPPFKHQREAIAYCINLPKAALWLDMGLGKTYTSINIARYRAKYQGISKIIVLAPRSLLNQWMNEIDKYVPEEHSVYIIEGTPTRKCKLLAQAANEDKLTFAITTYESLTGIKQQVQGIPFDMFILDESTKIKNPKAVRSKVAIEVCNDIPYGVELTGLAYLNNPIDLYSQFLALDKTVYGNNVWTFGDYFIDYVKMPFGRAMRGLRHVDELKRRAYFIAFSRRKEDCLDLPEKVYASRTMPMYDTQKVWYDKISAEITAAMLNDPALQGIGNITNVLTQLEKLQQITAGFILTEDHDVIWLDSPKYAEACDMVQESSEQFIIWCRHTEAMNRMEAALANRKIDSLCLNRNTSASARIHGIKRFKDGKLKVLICQIMSESKGLDLTSKSGSVNAIYLENDFSIDNRHQSESRQHRIGMKGTATYTDLILEDTIDEHVVNILKSKLHISEYIAKHGLNIIMGKGGSVTTRRSRSKKPIPKPDDERFKKEEIDVSDLEGFDDV